MIDVRLGALRVCLVLLAGLFLAAGCGRRESKPCADAAEEESSVAANDLSNQKVSSFAEDSLGHIWIGTFRGLNKYSVHEYRQYFCTDDTASLPDNQINDILRDSRGSLWVATVNGLCRQTDCNGFRRVPQNLKNNNGVQLLETKDGRLLLSFMHQLGCYDTQTDSLKLVISRLDPEHTFNLRCFVSSDNKLWTASPLYVRCYNTATFELEYEAKLAVPARYSYMQPDGTLWLTGSRTIVLFDMGSRSFRPLPQSLAASSLLRQSDIDCIHPYGDHSLLLSAGKTGLFLYDFATGNLVHQDEKGFPFEAPKFKISRMFTDSQQNLWIGSADQGYTVRYHYKERFNTNNYLQHHFNHKSVTSLAIDGQRNLWITTLTDGLFVYNMNSHEVKSIAPAPLGKESDAGNADISRVFASSDGSLWLAYNLGSKLLRCRYNGATLATERAFNVFMPMSLAEDEAGNVWVGTCSNQLFVCKKDADTLTSAQALGHEMTFISGLLPVGKDEIYVAAFMQPVMKVSASTLKAAPVALQEGDWQTCISRSVFIPTDVFRDSRGDIWFGTVANGLLRYTRKDGRIAPVSGAPCRDVESIEEDAQGNVWVGTQYGLGKYDRKEGAFTNYYAADGIGGNQFYDRSSCRLPDGTLSAANRSEGSGAVFTLRLPIDEAVFKDEEKAPAEQNQSAAFPLKPVAQAETGTDGDEESPRGGRKTLLVVDDDTEVVHYLKVLFAPYYTVVCRFDAESALQSMADDTPDLVLSDVVMPGTSGYELCRRIKEDLQLCHIPVILVTAKATTNDSVEGLNTGADAYVTKPFDPKYLLALIQSQLKNREKVRSILSEATQTDKIGENVLAPQDNAFMTDVYRIMEQELANSELDVQEMTSLLGISRTKFYYKVKGLTGKSPSVFFKTYKLNRAAELIKEGRNTVSEIAYMTGFSTLSHFSTVFKKQFGVAPSEYGH